MKNTNKPHLSLHQQVDLLQTRGIIIDDRESAEYFLLKNNYYNVVNCFNRFIKDDTSIETYPKGIAFKELESIYYFDRNLKSIFFKYLSEIERHFKSILSHSFSKNKINKNFYLEYDYYVNNSSSTKKCINKIREVIIENTKPTDNPNSIYHYHFSHGHIPIWVLLNYISFGHAIWLYKIINQSEKDKIAKYAQQNFNYEYKTNLRLNPYKLISFLNITSEYRNRCAHDNRLIGFQSRTSFSYLEPIYSSYKLEANDPKKSPYAMFISSQLFLSKEQFAQFHNSLLREFKSFKRKCKVLDYNRIYSEIGFPYNWHLVKKKEQKR